MIVYVPGEVEVVEPIVRVTLPTEPDVNLMITFVEVELELVRNTEGLLTPAGETDAVRVTLPVKPILVTVTVDVAEPPAMKALGTSEVPANVKLLIMLIDTSTECRSEPLLPVRVTK